MIENVLDHLEIRCLACGVLSVHEARYCRQCGAMLRVDEFPGAGEAISPDAMTIELHEPKRHTTPLVAPVETAPAVYHTAELNEIDVEPEIAVVPEVEVVPEAKAAAVAAHPQSRKHALLRIAAICLIGIIGVGAVAAWGARRRRTENATSAISAAPNPGERLAAPDPPKPAPPVEPSAAPEKTTTTAPLVSRPADPPHTRLRTRGGPPPKIVDIEPAETAANRTDPRPAAPVTPARNNSPATRANRDSVDLYQRALNIVRGRDVKQLNRAELLQAMQYFENIKSGPNRAEAGRQAALLGREIDRRTWKNR